MVFGYCFLILIKLKIQPKFINNQAIMKGNFKKILKSGILLIWQFKSRKIKKKALMVTDLIQI